MPILLVKYYFQATRGVSKTELIYFLKMSNKLIYSTHYFNTYWTDN